MTEIPSIHALRRPMYFDPLEVLVSERVYLRGACMTRELGLLFGADTQVEPAVLMAYIETSEGTAMHAHTARSDDPLAQRKAAEELINRLWRAYVRATEKAVA
jgi:hypothetical protein